MWKYGEGLWPGERTLIGSCFSPQATISYNQIMHMQTVALPVHYQTLCESSKLYDPGQQYASHVKDLRLPEEPKAQYRFEPYSASAAQ